MAGSLQLVPLLGKEQTFWGSGQVRGVQHVGPGMFVESSPCLELCACFLTLTVTRGSSHVFDNKYGSLGSGNVASWDTTHSFLSYSTREMNGDGGR